jgi:hypothetical protein
VSAFGTVSPAHSFSTTRKPEQKEPSNMAVAVREDPIADRR